MGDIADVLPQDSATVQAIYDHYKRTGDTEQRRGYLGASQIGHECARYLWLSFHWVGREEFDGRIYRLFERGDMEEYRLVADLRAIGCEVHEVNVETGKQFEVKALGGHFSGHMDGCAVGIPEAPKTWHVLEFKTHNAKSFAFLRQNGVRKAKKMHYDQMMVYMHLTGMTRALYLACNKDTDELYSERIHYDKQYADNIMAFAERIITATGPGPGVVGTPDEKHLCEYCPYSALCSGRSMVAVPAEVNCRTCAHSTTTMDGNATWECSLLDNRPLSYNDQIRACPWHIFSPPLITFAHGVDAQHMPDGSVWVEYECPDGRRWRNGPDKASGHYSSQELTLMPASAVGAAAVSTVKTMFGGEVTAAKVGMEK